MKKEQCKDLKYFTYEEMTATGADIDDVKAVLMLSLDHFRKNIGTPVKLLKNGLTTGKHAKNSQHYLGGAADVYFRMWPKTLNTVVELAADAGFSGICLNGTNGKYVTIHLDLRALCWYARRDKDTGKYVDLINAV